VLQEGSKNILNPDVMKADVTSKIFNLQSWSATSSMTLQTAMHSMRTNAARAQANLAKYFNNDLAINQDDFYPMRRCDGHVFLIPKNSKKARR
jgi:hypothetical protein